MTSTTVFSAATQRTSLDLLSLPAPFSQVKLLTAADFAKEANRRRPRVALSHPELNEQILEELHRHGVLVPFFRVGLHADTPARAVGTAPGLTPHPAKGTIPSELLSAAAEGRVTDPASEEFSPWPDGESGHLYSRHQLLGLQFLYPLLAEFVPTFTGGGPILWHLGPADLPGSGLVESFGLWRSLAITVGALDTYYWPIITGRIGNDLAAWRRVRGEMDPAHMQDWLHLSREQLASQANHLKVVASMRDVLGDFYDLVRRSHAGAWETMRGDALAALDTRLAADVLDRFIKDVDGQQAAAGPLFRVPLSQMGLSEQENSLDAALTSLHLSPYPSLVIALEGQTEELIVPRVMDLLGIEVASNRIEFVNFEGSKDLMLLARYTTRPVLGKSYGDWVALDRPVTKFLVLTDPENKFRTPSDRRRMRRNLLESITFGFPDEYRKDLLGNQLRSRLVEVRTWGKYPFEFAHFTDRQLADALTKLAKVPHPGGRTALIAQVQNQRSRHSPDIDHVNWKGRGKISKPDLADALWPLLAQRIRRAVHRGSRGPAVMKAALRAYEMAAGLPRSGVALRRH